MAYEFYVSIEGTKQTKFSGESTRTKYKDQIEGFYFESAVASPRDPLSGQASGRRRHAPVLFRKRVGAASPMIAQALCTNELLKQVKFSFVRTAEDGTEKTYFTITLNNATISTAKFIVPDSNREKSAQDFYEEIALTFQKITWENVDAKTMATDDWNEAVEAGGEGGEGGGGDGGGAGAKS